MTSARLRQVESAESALRALGVTGNLRVRHHGELARIEIDREQLSRWSAGAALGSVLAAVCDAGFATAELDPRGFRSGALNVLSGVDTHVSGATVPGH